MPAPEPVSAWRVVAAPAALDAASWHGEDIEVLRVAPDEVLAIRATGVDVDDPHAIVGPEPGVSLAHLSSSDLDDVVGHTEWQVRPSGTGSRVLQGKIAGVPAKLVLGDPTLLVVQTCYVDDLRERLGW